MIEILPTAGRLGADVLGADLREPLEAATILQLVDAIVALKVLRIRKQDLTHGDYARFGSHFGQPTFFAALSDRDSGYPQLIHITNSPAIPKFQRDGAAFWHTDGTYDKVPVSTTMLHALEAPDEGGETLFADLAAAYAELPCDMRERIEGLQVLHRMSGGKRFADEKQVSEEGVAFGQTMVDDRGVQVTRHPLVLTHPLSGRKALCGIGGTSFGVDGLSAEEGEALLTKLKRFATQDRFCTAIKAHTGDILMWDCLSTIHRAVPIEYSNELRHRRILLRLSVTGLAEPYRHLPAPFVEDAIGATGAAA